MRFKHFLNETTLSNITNGEPERVKQQVMDVANKLFRKQGKEPGSEPLGIPYIREIVEQGNAERFIEQGKRLLSLNSPFKGKTGMPTYDDMLAMPEYFQNKKGMFFKEVWMSPDEYLRRSEMGFKRAGEAGGFTPNRKLVREYAERMVDGSKAPLPTLVYEMHEGGKFGFTQEGRHRASAAKYLGIQEIPVLVVVRPDSPATRDSEKYANFVHNILNRFD